MSASMTPVNPGVLVFLSEPIWLAHDYSDPADPDACGLRATARIAFVFFMLAYVVRPLVRVPGSGQWQVRFRRFLEFAAALAHTVHLVYIARYFRLTGTSAEPVPVIFVGPGLRVCAWFRPSSAVRPAGV